MRLRVWGGGEPAVHAKCWARRDAAPRENVSRGSFHESGGNDGAVVAAAAVFKETGICLQLKLCVSGKKR